MPDPKKERWKVTWWRIHEAVTDKENADPIDDFDEIDDHFKLKSKAIGFARNKSKTTDMQLAQVRLEFLDDLDEWQIDESEGVWEFNVGTFIHFNN